MILLQDASFEVPKIKTWKRRYVQLDFHVSVKELQDMAKELSKESYRKLKGWKDLKWICTAFMEKCQCDECKPGWEAYEKAKRQERRFYKKKRIMEVK